MHHLALNFFCFFFGAAELHDFSEAPHDLISQMIEYVKDILTAHWHMCNLLRFIVIKFVLVWTTLSLPALPHVLANLFLDIGSGIGVDFLELGLDEELPGR